jgi:hypothetical protein
MSNNDMNNKDDLQLKMDREPTPEDAVLIDRLIDRALAVLHAEQGACYPKRSDLFNDIAGTHLNAGLPATDRLIDLPALINASDTEFFAEVFDGMRKHFDWKAGRLRKGWWPKFASVARAG